MSSSTSNYQHINSILFYLLYSSLVAVCLSSPSPAQLCHNDESIALLQFKQLFSINSFATSQYSYYCLNEDIVCNPKTDNWKEGRDCCAWDGVTCENNTGHVIGLNLRWSCLYGTIHPNSSLFNLVHLQKLDLACNDFNLSQILPSFGHFKNLTHLDLSSSRLSGQIPSSSSSEEEVSSQGKFPNGIFHLPELQMLNLSGNRELTGKIPSSINGTLWHHHLRWLDLSSTGFTGELPNSIGQFRYLEMLDLSACNFWGTIPRSIGDLTKLRYLNLGSTNCSGQLPSSITQLKNLEMLELSACNLSGTIPISLGNLTKLRYLSLGGNNLTSGQLPSSVGQLKNLETLYLFGCNFSGTIPTSIGNLTRLSYLDLTSNYFSGKLPSSISDLENLSYLYLSHNNFEGPIPQLFAKLTNLISLALRGNSLSGQLPSFSNFSQLYWTDFAENQLTGPIPSSIIGLQNLHFLDLGSNSINGTIPSSLFHLVYLTRFFLSSNKLSGIVELDMFAKLENLEELDLSNSGLSLTTTNSTRSFPSIKTLLLSSCNISKIPESLKTRKEFLEILDLLKNKIYEELHPLICDFHSLQYLDLSNNQFFGFIPACLGNLSENLLVLNLQRNNFHGAIPQTCGNTSMLQTLDISHNGLQGVLPRSLANCKNLEILNVGGNLIVDVFPFWLENLSELKVLVLRDNKFHGPIGHPMKRSVFTNLHIIDVSHNDFTGSLPSKYFQSWHSMMMADDETSHLNYMGNIYGYYSVTIMNKGLEMVFVRILTIFKAVDFSHNKFHGKIPISIGRLKALRVLNFSGNSLTGPIPLSFGNLTELESLDLSQNKLSGKIPQQLTTLTFLAVFDVSQNNLTGIIPRGQQFETFSNTSYEGNPGLCGFPLSKKCGSLTVAKPPSLPSPLSHKLKYKFDGFGWEAVSMGYGCGVVLGLAIGSCITQRKEEWIMKIFGVKTGRRMTRMKKLRLQRGGRCVTSGTLPPAA